jgi:hypothetical protein
MRLTAAEGSGVAPPSRTRPGASVRGVRVFDILSVVPTRSWSDDQLRDAVASSQNLYQVCLALEISPGARTYALLRRHINRLEIDAAHLPTVERRRTIRAWSDDALKRAVAENVPLAGVLRALGYTPSGGMHRYLRAYITDLGLDTSHFRGQGWSRGLALSGRGPRLSLDEILVRSSPYRSTSNLRQRLIAEGLKEGRCEHCGLSEWMGRELPLALDHVNGDPTDNRLENLRILCPNCHALTDTWCTRNRKPA